MKRALTYDFVRAAILRPLLLGKPKERATTAAADGVAPRPCENSMNETVVSGR